MGTRFPAYCASMGRVLLAAQPDEWIDDYLARLELRPFTARTITDPDRLRRTLAKVRSQGFALVDQELEEQLRSVAAPVQGLAARWWRP